MRVDTSVLRFNFDLSSFNIDEERGFCFGEAYRRGPSPPERAGKFDVREVEIQVPMTTADASLAGIIDSVLEKIDLLFEESLSYACIHCVRAPVRTSVELQWISFRNLDETACRLALAFNDESTYLLWTVQVVWSKLGSWSVEGVSVEDW